MIKTGSVFIPTTKDRNSVLLLRLYGNLRLILLNSPSNSMNAAVCGTSEFFFFPTHQVTRVVMLFQSFAGKITPLSLVLVLTQLFQRGHGSLPLVVTTWPFGNATAAGRRTQRRHLPWRRWTRSPAQATWPRSRHRTQIGFRIRATCRLTGQLFRERVQDPNPLFFNLSLQNHITQICASADSSGRVSAVWKEPEKLQAVSFRGDCVQL